MKLRIALSILLLFFSFQQMGCWTSASTGEKLQIAGRERDQRIRSIQDTIREDRGQLERKIVQLEEVLERARNLLSRENADRGVQLDQFQQKIALLEGQLDELRHSIESYQEEMTKNQHSMSQRLDIIARKSGIDMPVSDAEIPDDKEAHFKAGREALDSSEHSKARALFREYISRYPNDEKADDAHYWIGISYLSENKPATALGEFRKVLAKYEKGNAVSVVLFGMAEAFFRLQACTDAKNALKALIRRKPPKKLLRRAKDMLRKIEKVGKRECTS